MASPDCLYLRLLTEKRAEFISSTHTTGKSGRGWAIYTCSIHFRAGKAGHPAPTLWAAYLDSSLIEFEKQAKTLTRFINF